MNGRDSIQVLKGIGTKSCELFQKMNIWTIDDLVSFYPRSYITYENPQLIGDVETGIRVSVEGTIQAPLTLRKIRNLTLIAGRIGDTSGKIDVIWFNMPYLKNQLRSGQTYVFVGIPVYRNNRIVIEHPEYYTQAAYRAKKSTMQPVYSLTKGLSNKSIQKAMEQTKEYIRGKQDYLTLEIRKKFDLMERSLAMEQVHFPMNKERLMQARRRIIFDEFFQFLLNMYRMKEEKGTNPNRYDIPECKECQELIDSLPYRLTGAQINAFKDIVKDFQKPYVMNRLIQGDVGSGKTIVAELALLMTVTAGYQGAFMVPTEVLAGQHYQSLCDTLGTYGVRIGLLTGSLTAKEKHEMYEKIYNHEIDVVVGTHALIQEKVVYQDLALVITDEQHRFGVKQREALSKKGLMPHVLVMSATPIPRTLALIMYGDLDISVMDELPSNRLPIKNCVVDTGYRQTAFRFIANQVKQGRQAYVICPMVEESEAIDAENVMDYAKTMQASLPDLVIETLNGQMKAEEKNKILRDFAQKKIDVLVSTTVIEVGINVPNASVILIENAERFGLAQIHQLRGRVGRGEHQSYCIMIQGTKNKEVRERLEILSHSNDGFYIANEDLKLRGPGDFFGVRQSGVMDFQLADIYNHAEILQTANCCLNQFIDEKRNLDALYGKIAQNLVL